MSQCDFEQLELLINVRNEDCSDPNCSDSNVEDNMKKLKVEMPNSEFEGNVKTETYVPVNFISDEVYAMIASWETANLAMSSGVSMPSDVLASLPLESASQNYFEPIRQINDFSPPKRFSKRLIAPSRAQSSQDVSEAIFNE